MNSILVIVFIISGAIESNSITIISKQRWSQAGYRIDSAIENHEVGGLNIKAETGRRRLIKSLIAFSSYQSQNIVSHSYAEEDKTSLLENTPTSSKKDITIKAICDPTIDSYRKGARRIHVLGTAHISSLSSRLSSDTVKETKPQIVFLELDLQRISRAFRNGKINEPTTILFFKGDYGDDGGRIMLHSVILAPQQLGRRSRWMFRIFENLAQNPIQKMYNALEERGITPGEEFITAVEEGVKIGSLIILGDRQMDITMRRLTSALIFRTDPRQLMEADDKIISKIRQHIPQLAQLEQQKKGIPTEDLTWFVEQIKTKEATMDIMKEMQEAVPEIYQALIGERDVFMAQAMNLVFSILPLISSPSLSRLSSHSSIQTMVSVIGLGHLSGVGDELVRLGWRKFKPDGCL